MVQDRKEYFRQYNQRRYWSDPEKYRQIQNPNRKRTYTGEGTHEAKQQRQQRREEYVRNYLVDHPCTRCGMNDIRVLQFHHRNPVEKEYTVSQMARSRMAEEKIVSEIDKCDILCANCHWIVHAEMRETC